MAGEIEGALADQTYQNKALVNFLPYTCVDVDTVNSDAINTAVLYNAGPFPCETLGVVYDQSKLDPSGNPIKNSGVAVRHWGIARVVVTGAVTPGQYLSVANASGQCAAQAVTGGAVVRTLTLTPAAVAANTTAEQSFVVGAPWAATDVIEGVSKPTAQAGLGIVGWRMIDGTHVGITFSNNTASPITPTAGEVYSITVTPASATNEALKPVVGRALTAASALNDTPLVLLMIGARV